MLIANVQTQGHRKNKMRQESPTSGVDPRSRGGGRGLFVKLVCLSY